jgi:hypothetical protein
VEINLVLLLRVLLGVGCWEFSNVRKEIAALHVRSERLGNDDTLHGERESVSHCVIWSRGKERDGSLREFGSFRRCSRELAR